MEPVKTVKSSSSSPTPNLHKILRTLSKILRLRTSHSRLCKIKYKDGVQQNHSVLEEKEKIEKQKKKQEEDLAMVAFLAKLFASTSTIKAAYAQLQLAQSPYNPDDIQFSDQVVVTELKHLSELKQSFLKRQLDGVAPQVTLLLAEVKELKSVSKSYEIMGKKFDSQLKLKDSEILFLKEKLEDSDEQNELLEKQLELEIGEISLLDNLELSDLSAKHFGVVLRLGVVSIRRFVKLIVSKMTSAGWDLDAAAKSIEPGIVYKKLNQTCFAFEAFVCRQMFDGFQIQNFSDSNEPKRPQCKSFFSKFMELKSANVMEMLKVKPGCSFGKFCRVKYLGVIHPKMESAFFGDLNQRNVVNSGGYPETGFFTAFAEMAKHVWLLHCLALSFEPEVTIFQVRKGCRFSEVYMENVGEEDEEEEDLSVVDHRVGFTVIPGFKIGKTVIQCQVYVKGE